MLKPVSSEQNQYFEDRGRQWARDIWIIRNRTGARSRWCGLARESKPKRWFSPSPNPSTSDIWSNSSTSFRMPQGPRGAILPTEPRSPGPRIKARL